MAMNNYAHILWSLGRFDEAEPLYKETLERRRRVLGEDDNDYLQTFALTDVNIPLGHVLIDGTNVAQTLRGTQYADHIRALEGDDILDGGLDDDLLEGGGGADVFRFATGGGHDVITDFASIGKVNSSERPFGCKSEYFEVSSFVIVGSAVTLRRRSHLTFMLPS